MNYTEFMKRIRSSAGSEKLGFRQFGLCLHPRHLPLTLVSVEGSDPVVVVPGRAKTKYGNKVPVTAVSKTAFMSNDTVTDIFLPHTVETVQDGAFAGCRNLRNMTIPRSVRWIGNGTFDGCDNLENIYYEGTKEEWETVEIVRQRWTVSFGGLVPGTPVETVTDDRITPVPGNEALFFCSFHFNCPLKAAFLD